MKTFEVLNRSQDIHRNYLLEASAGTGKTFSIENIVVRLLIEEKPLLIEEVLVVTFTRAATRDLKTRIRSNIEKTLFCFRNHETESPSEDYVKAVLEQGEDAILLARRRLEQALLCYDQSQIYTIHGFCSRILSDLVFEGDMGIEMSSEEDPLPKTYILSVIRDFFRTEIRPEKYSKEQLENVLKNHEQSMEKLERELLSLVTQGIEITEPPDYSSLFSNFQVKMLELKNSFNFSSESIVSDFMKLAPCHEKLCGRDRKPKQENIDKVIRFGELFDRNEWEERHLNQLIEEGLFLVDAFSPKRRNKKALPPAEELNHQDIASILRKNLLEFVSPEITFTRMAYDCKKLLKRHLNEEEKLGFDELLEAANRALKNDSFLTAVREKFKAAIIDEFQDTDPVQWNIFNTLFLYQAEEWGNLYLVGDPKQSIYAFRQADIYTYLGAGDALGEDNRASLNTNFRSQPDLVEALNEIFCEETSPNLISLPKTNGSLPYVKVHYSTLVEKKSLSDELGALHFYIAEDVKAKKLSLEEFEKKQYFPFMAQEIQRLNRQDSIALKDIAILVSDRYQSQRVADYLNKWNIPCVTQRSSTLAESEALSSLKEMIKGVLNPTHESSLKTALGGKIIGWTDVQVIELDDPIHLQDQLSKFYFLRSQLISEGFSKFFQDLLNSSFKEVNVLESIFTQEGGERFFQDLQQIVDAVLEFERKNHASPESILRFLDDFHLLLFNDDERIKRASDPTLDAVNILTLHTSKGLEFGVVFALALIKRTKQPGQLIPVSNQESRSLVVIADKEDGRYVKYCQEMDAEKIRQLYVAMTRAKYRLYAPLALVPSAKAIDPGCASPMDLFLARLGQPLIELENLYDRINGYTGDPFYALIEGSDKSITFTQLSVASFVIEEWENSSSFNLTPPEEVTIKWDPTFMVSFTTLSKKLSSHSGGTGAPHDFMEENKTPLTLPSGSDTGNILHTILENVPIELAKSVTAPSDLLDFIHPFVASSPFEEWEGVICEIVFNAFKTKLSERFCLADLDPDLIFRETEFLYPYESNFLKGIIDMLFMHEGKYYILDWKSNWLGSSSADYSNDKMKTAMEEHHYFLQAKLYKEAVKKYLKIMEQKDFDSIFGGVYYLFLRGLTHENNEKTGVYVID